MSGKPIYPIRYAARRTNLTPHVIRAWEKRYKAVVPQRSQKNRRLYSEDDIERLYILKIITDAGHNISQVARLKSAELKRLAERENFMGSRSPANKPQSDRPMAVDDYYSQCLAAVRELDSDGLERTYDQAAVDLTRSTLVRDLIKPLFEEIGNLWRNGSLKIVNEHMATSVTRNFLLSMLRALEISEYAPKIVVATTVGQWHDIGALTVALTAAENGWHPIYYGPNLPAEEIAAAVRKSRAQALAISISHALDQHLLVAELSKLRRYIGPGLTLFVGGGIMGKLVEVVDGVNAKHLARIDQFRDELNMLLLA